METFIQLARWWPKCWWIGITTYVKKCFETKPKEVPLSNLTEITPFLLPMEKGHDSKHAARGKETSAALDTSQQKDGLPLERRTVCGNRHDL